MSENLHRRLIAIVLGLYLVATWSSMAGMEIFGWLTFILSVTYLLRKPADGWRFQDFDQVLPWRSMIAMYLIVVAGVIFVRTDRADVNFMLGNPRWVFLLFSSSIALSIAPPTLKGYRLFLVFTAVIAAYAVFQSFTGIDLLRPGSERAVQRLDVRKEIQLWRSAGLFGSPMGYVYIAGMYSCLPLAVALLFPKEAKRLRWFSIAAFVVIAASLVTTYVRGAWFAMAIAYLAMIWIARRKIFYAAIGAGTAAFVVLFTTFIQFRERIMSLFDPAYASNNDRWLLWKMNWEMFKDYPLIGIGWGENETRAKEYMIRMGHPKAFTGHAHNNYLEALAGTGILGLTAFMFFVGFFLWLTWRIWKRLPEDLVWARALVLGSFGAQIFLHVGGFTECNFKAGATNHNLMIVLALVVGLSVLEKKGLLRERTEAKGLASWPTL